MTTPQERADAIAMLAGIQDRLKGTNPSMAMTPADVGALIDFTEEDYGNTEEGHTGKLVRHF